MSIRVLLLLALVSLTAACTDLGSPPTRDCRPACGAGFVCESGACVEVSQPDAGAQCARDGDCPRERKRCDLAASVCVECLQNGDCPSGQCNEGRSCAPLPDSCGLALEIDLAKSSGAVESSTASANDDVLPGCALGSGAPDVVYRLKVPSVGRLRAVATPKNPASYQPVLLLTRTCTGEDEVSCGYAKTTNPSAELSVELQAGEYFLWVDGDSGTSGEFTLSVTWAAPSPGDFCAAPIQITSAQMSGAIINGSTATSRDDTFGTCGGTANDTVYALDITSPARVILELTPTTTGFEPSLYVRRPNQCAVEGGAAQLGCARQYNGQAKLDLPRLEPGRYFVFVDGDSLSSQPNGGFQLKVTTGTALVAPANDTCSGAQNIVAPAFGGPATITVTGDATTALSDSSSVCGGAGPDVVYLIKTVGPRKVTIRVTPSTMWTPVLYVRKPGACADTTSASLVACNRAPQIGGSTTLTLPNVQGELPLYVDAVGNSAGAFSLAVDFADPVSAPANDTCAAPQLLSGSGGAFTVTGTTTGANDDARTCTFPDGANSADVVYRLDVAAPSSLTLDVSATTGSALMPVITLRKPNACGSNADADQLLCAWPDPADPYRATRIAGELAAGSYYLWIDGDITTHGAFLLKANLGAPIAPPANDNCNTALPLTPSLAVISDTRSASNDSAGWCGTTNETAGAFAPDAVFQFDNPTAQSRTLTVVPDLTEGRLLRPIVYVRGPGAPLCGSLAQSSQVGCAVASTLGGTATLSLPNLPAGTYSVWVDGVAQQSGRFTIKLQ